MKSEIQKNNNGIIAPKLKTRFKRIIKLKNLYYGHDYLIA